MLPHISNIQAGANKWDPMISSVFRVEFKLPDIVRKAAGQDNEIILSEQVTDIAGLDALQKTPTAGQQKFLGVDVSFLNPVLDNTFADLTVNLNLNLKNVTDAYVLKVFKLWEKAGYDLITGARTLKKQYCGSMKVYEANRNGIVWRVAWFHDVMLTGVTNIDSLDYTQNEARKLTCTFRSDYWTEELGNGLTSNYGVNSTDEYNYTYAQTNMNQSFAGNQFDINNSGWAPKKTD